MKLTLMAKLAPDATQKDSLLRTLEAFNAGCNYASGIAFGERCANKFQLQRLVYRDLRDRFGLSAQMAVRAIGKVVDAYKRDRKIKPTFGLHSAMIYDDRIYSFKGVDRVSLLTLDGRIIVPVLLGPYQAERMHLKRGQADLLYRDGTFYLSVSVDASEPEPAKPEGFMGVDFGVVNVAATSDGDTFSGKAVNNVRARFSRFRGKLQKKGTKSARRLLKKRSGRERRFQRDVNHCIAKTLVTRAKDTRRGIAIEDLKHIRSRGTFRRAQRKVIHSWAFADLRFKIEYKARLAGVVVVAVDPRNTSRTCPVCGCIDKANRRTQSQFLCTGCGYSANADQNAARIIAGRASAMRPNAATLAG